jgi:hypothetical protein
MALSDRPGPFPRDYGCFSAVVSLASGDDDREIIKAQGAWGIKKVSFLEALILAPLVPP